MTKISTPQQADKQNCPFSVAAYILSVFMFVSVCSFFGQVLLSDENNIFAKLASVLFILGRIFKDKCINISCYLALKPWWLKCSPSKFI